MSAADRLEDTFPHGTADGYDAGCRGVICPGATEHGLSCQRAKQLAAGDYQYQKLVRRGASPAEIAEALGLHPAPAGTHPDRRPKPAKKPKKPDLPVEVDHETQEAPMPIPTPADVAAKVKPKRKPPAGPSQSVVRAWARENGLDVNPRGTVRADVVRAYLAAHAPILSKVEHAPMTPPVAMPIVFDVPEGLPPIIYPVSDAVGQLRTERDTAHTALELVIRKWAAERVRTNGLQRALDDERQRLAAFARMLSSYQAEAAADAEHIRSMDRLVLELTEENDQLRTPWWQRRVS